MKTSYELKTKSRLELLGCYTPSDVRQGLTNEEPIVYTENGNRTRSAATTLKMLSKVIGRVGVTRVAEISQLVDVSYPVFQAVRPNILIHSSIGQNTGSQGKGPTKAQAQISTMMEALEAYCAEPKHARFIRGSYDFLRRQHLIVPPTGFFPFPFTDRVTLHEPLMWTQAYHVETRREVLIPAEEVFFPFLPKDFKTKSHFPMTSNGLAAGSTYLEAVNHALYEVIERYYMACREVDKDNIVVHRLSRDEFSCYEKLRNISKHVPDAGVFSIRFKKGPNIPCLMAYYMKDGQGFAGYSCAPTVEMAASRALSEAAQSAATFKSGAREDMGQGKRNFSKLKSRMSFFEAPLPSSVNLSKRQLCREVGERNHKNLRAEFEYLVKWIHERGFKNICIANLTRKGIDVPVVKVVVPAMAAWFHHLDVKAATTFEIHKLSYRIKRR